jgi:hypothetical protein
LSPPRRTPTPTANARSKNVRARLTWPMSERTPSPPPALAAISCAVYPASTVSPHAPYWKRTPAAPSRDRWTLVTSCPLLFESCPWAATYVL